MVCTFPVTPPVDAECDKHLVLQGLAFYHEATLVFKYFFEKQTVCVSSIMN